MAMTVKDEGGNIYVMRITGLLKKSECDVIQNEAAKAMDNDPQMQAKILLIVENFMGWEKGADWGDTSFFSRHGEKITKIAIAADPKWESGFKMFTGAGFRTAPVKFFPSDQIEQARQWLAE